MITIVVTASDGATVTLMVADPTVLADRVTDAGNLRVTDAGNQRIVE